MMAMLDRVQREGATRDDVRRIAKEAKPRAAKGRPRHYVFRYQPREKSFSLALQFKKSHADRDEIIRVLQAILADLTR
jgi:hypothetical protein